MGTPEAFVVTEFDRNAVESETLSDDDVPVPKATAGGEIGVVEGGDTITATPGDDTGDIEPADDDGESGEGIEVSPSALR